jgi:signal transduction histidine kinase
MYFTGIVTDLTETKALQDRIIRSERLAALGQVVAEISHEIKNPLVMIGGFARQLAQQTREEKNIEKLHIIVDEVGRLENLLKELLELYAPRTLDLENVAVDDLLQEVHDLVKAECESKKIKTELTTEKEKAFIRGDRVRLKQVLLNIVKNAIEAMGQGGNLSVRSQRKEDRVEIDITDNGCGISPEEMERIFSPFYTTKQHGTGLGLSISKSIIEEHQGSSISVKSEKGKGTSFNISLPVVQVENEYLDDEIRRSGQ